MTRNVLWRGVFIAVLSMALATQGLAGQPHLAAHAVGLQKVEDEVTAGIVVVAVVVAVVVVVLVRHRPQRITGCVNPGANGMSVTDEKDKRSYALSGNTAGVKAGFRMTLEGKRKHAGQTFAFDTHKVGRDFGVCLA